MRKKMIANKVYRKTLDALTGSGLQKFKVINRLNTMLRKATTPEHVLIDGDLIYLDKIDILSLSTGDSDNLKELEHIKKLIKPHMTVVEIGGHIGWDTINMAKIARRVIAFEPEMYNYFLLSKNVHKNGYTNVETKMMAVGDKNTLVQLYVSDSHSGDHHTVRTKNRKVDTVRMVRIDDEIKEKVHLIKMDVQGTEYQAFQGMKKTLEANPDVILITEFWAFGLKRAKTEPSKYLSELVMRFEVKELGCMDLLTKDRINKLCNDDSYDNYTNLVCTQRR